jgi:hypothetical protein
MRLGRHRQSRGASQVSVEGMNCERSGMTAAQCVLIALTLSVADLAAAKDPFILASGRRDPRIYAIDLKAALRPENNNTPNAIVSRSLSHENIWSAFGAVGH